ncbi:MAG TPA: hypothetical protein VJY33_14535 [Isosphaeraceae bacterium]|nr:hypothetical protein [Isosphaeraceae bacterium]
MSRQRVYRCAATALLFLSLSVGGSILTARQEPPKPIPEPPGAAVERKELRPPHRQHTDEEAKRIAGIYLERFDTFGLSRALEHRCRIWYKKVGITLR